MPFLYQTFYNFRNLKNDTIDLSPKEIFFVGENGQGKSNILESLYYAAYGISFRTHVDSQIVKKGEKNFSINSVYNDNDGVQKISIIFENIWRCQGIKDAEFSNISKEKDIFETEIGIERNT